MLFAVIPTFGCRATCRGDLIAVERRDLGCDVLFDERARLKFRDLRLSVLDSGNQIE